MTRRLLNNSKIFIVVLRNVVYIDWFEIGFSCEEFLMK